MRQKKKTTNKKVSKKQIISETISEVIDGITYSFAKLKDGTVRFDKKGKLDNSYYKTINELLKAKEKETIKNDGYDQVRKSLLLWQILANHFEGDPEGEYFEDIKEVYKKSPYSNYKNILENPISLGKTTLTTTPDFLDEELKGIENIDNQIEYLEKLKIYYERKLTETKKETIILSKSFLKIVIEKDNFNFIDINNLESLLDDEHYIDTIYYQLIKHEKLLINSKDIHLLETFYTKQNRQNIKLKNEKDFKPAIAPFSHIRVDIIEKEINLINLYLRVREGFREYLKNKDLNNNKYCFDYDIPLVIMFSRLLKSISEKKFYLNKILERTKLIVEGNEVERNENEKIELLKKEDIYKINNELKYLDLNLEVTEENTKDKKNNNAIILSKRILLNIERIKWYEIIKYLIKYQRIGYKNNDEEINILITNHFICNDDKGGELNECGRKINWIGTIESFIQFAAILEGFKIIKDKKDINKNYCNHFEIIKNGINILTVEKIKDKKCKYKYETNNYNYKDDIKDDVIKDIIDLLN